MAIDNKIQVELLRSVCQRFDMPNYAFLLIEKTIKEGRIYTKLGRSVSVENFCRGIETAREGVKLSSTLLSSVLYSGSRRDGSNSRNFGVRTSLPTLDYYDKRVDMEGHYFTSRFAMLLREERLKMDRK